MRFVLSYDHVVVTDDGMFTARLPMYRLPHSQDPSNLRLKARVLCSDEDLILGVQVAVLVTQ